MKLNKLYNTISPRTWCSTGALLFISIWYFSWILFVDPAPDKDATAFFSQYEHYLAMVQSGITPFVDFSTWLALSGDLPPAMMMIPTSMGFLGLENLFLSQLWFREIFLIIPIVLIPFVLSDKNDKTFEFTLVLFFFPVTQILLKGFEHHSYNTIYTLLGFVFVYKYTLSRNTKLLSGFVIFCTFSNLVKHMGLIHFVSIVMAIMVIESRKDKFDRSLWFAIGLVITITAMLYPYQQTVQVIHSTLRHTHSIGITKFLLGSIVIGVGGIAITILTARFSKKIDSPNFFKYGYLLILALLFTIWLLLTAGKDKFFIPIFICGYTTVLIVVFLFSTQSKLYFPLLVFVISFTHAALLFTLKIASTFYIFHFSLILLLVYTYYFSKSSFNNRLILFVCFICSNFFPSLSYLESNKSVLQHAYSHLFLSLHQNPLGWEKSDLRKVQREMMLTLKSYEPPVTKPLLVSTINLDFSTREVLNFLAPHTFHLPPVYHLDQAPQEKIESIIGRYKADQQKLFNDWTNMGKITIWIEGIKPWTQHVFPAVEPIDFDSELYTNYKFSTDLPQEYWNELNNKGLLKKYYTRYQIPDKNPRINIYIHNILKQ